jgi:UDP-2-acetamido-2-deoxy-ribo-hexuluronate aminotransferase
LDISFVDLIQQFRRLEPTLRQRLNDVFTHGQYIMGPEVLELERDLADFVSVSHVIGCASGTDALLIPLMAHDVGPGDAIFTTPFTFVASAEVIALLGATPVFVDIDPRTFNIDPLSLTQAVDRIRDSGELRPRGIIPVDLFGIPADYDAIEAIAEKYQLFVLEDAAQSFGAWYKGRRTGSLGDMAATSFFPAKPLGGYGDGGAIFTNDDGLVEKLHSIRVHGQSGDRYNNVRVGLNARLDTLQAAVVLAKMTIFEEELDTRQRVASQYRERLQDVVHVPHVPAEIVSSWAQYSILSNYRDAIHSGLASAGIPTAIYYPIPLHLQTVFGYLDHKAGDFPICEEVSCKIISLPMHPYLTEVQIERICDGVITAVQTQHDSQTKINR